MTGHEVHRSEFEAPPYTKLEQKQVGNKIITTVVMDGEICEFEVNAVAHHMVKQATVPLDQRFETIVEGF